MGVTSTSVRIFWDKTPDKPYIVLGKISVESEDRGEEAIFSRVNKKAMSIGADGLLMGDSSKVVKPVGYFSVERRRIEALAIRFTDSQ